MTEEQTAYEVETIYPTHGRICDGSGWRHTNAVRLFDRADGSTGYDPHHVRCLGCANCKLPSTEGRVSESRPATALETADERCECGGKREVWLHHESNDECESTICHPFKPVEEPVSPPSPDARCRQCGAVNGVDEHEIGCNWAPADPRPLPLQEGGGWTPLEQAVRNIIATVMEQTASGATTVSWDGRELKAVEEAIRAEAEARHERDWADAHRRHSATIDRLNEARRELREAQEDRDKYRTALEAEVVVAHEVFRGRRCLLCQAETEDDRTPVPHLVGCLLARRAAHEDTNGVDL